MTRRSGKGRPRQLLGYAALPLATAVLAVFAISCDPGLRTSEFFQGGPAPDFELTAFDDGEFAGRLFSLEGLRGQIVVLNFWASWCAECEKEMKALEEAWQTYRGRGVWVIGVDYRDFDEKALAMLERYDISYPNGPDRRSAISDRYRVSAVPETVFIDPQGIVSHVQIGPISRTRLHQIIGQMLADRNSPAK